jgi:hypothetical protein
MSVEQILLNHQETKLQTEQQLGLLVREVSAFANNNPRFKRGESDYMAIKLIDGDRIEPAFENSDDDDQVITAPSMEFTYSFEAERKRIYDDRGKERAQVIFMFSAAALLQNTVLPGHIAEAEYGLPPKEAIREAGLVTLKKEQLFTVQTETRTLSLCESVEYMDEDGDTISTACSCGGGEEIYYIPDMYIEDMNTVDIDNEDIEITQYPNLAAEERFMHETILFSTPEEASEQWNLMESIGGVILDNLHYDRVLNARSVLAGMQRAFREQLGI